MSSVPTLRRLLLKWVDATRPLRGLGLRGDLIAVVIFAVALGVRFAVDHLLPPGFPYLTFFPAIILTTFFFGLRPGIVSALLGGVAAWYFFIGPSGSFAMGGPAAIALGFYFFIAAVDITLIHVMHVIAAQLRDEVEAQARMAEQRRTMFQELQHRVANNMQFVAALLSMYKRKAGNDPQAILGALDDASLRLQTISQLHRHLHDPANTTRPVGEFFTEVCSGMIAAGGHPGIRCEVDMPLRGFDLTQLTPLSLVVVEIMTNALKHAFPDGTGIIALSMTETPDGGTVLTVSDNGRGMPQTDPKSGSLGLRIVQNLSAQLNATVTFEDARPGTRVRIVLPPLKDAAP